MTSKEFSPHWSYMRSHLKSRFSRIPPNKLRRHPTALYDTSCRRRRRRSGERGAELIPPQWHQRKLLAKLPFHTTSARYDVNQTYKPNVMFHFEYRCIFVSYDQPSHSWRFSLAHAWSYKPNPNKQVWNAAKKGGEAGREEGPGLANQWCHSYDTSTNFCWRERVESCCPVGYGKLWLWIEWVTSKERGISNNIHGSWKSVTLRDCKCAKLPSNHAFQC